MAKILFVAFDLTPFGYGRDSCTSVATISSLAKAHGHQTDLVFVRDNAESRSVFRDRLREFAPDVVGFSIMSHDFRVATEFSQMVKRESRAITLFGGTHPTILPDLALDGAGVDYICVGEGEYPTLEVLDRIDAGESFGDVANLQWRDGEETVRNPMRRLNDLSELPRPDADLLLGDRRNVVYHTTATFGCPYPCTYCCNASIKEVYKGSGRFIRRKPTDKLIDEIVAVDASHNITTLSFVDATFAMDRKWVLSFCEAYRERVGKPFYFGTTITSVDSDLLHALHDAGCVRILFGIESGDEDVRRDLLLKRIGTNEEIVRTIAAVKEAGILAGAFFIIGFPGETADNIRQTYRFASESGLDLVRTAVFYPYRNTPLFSRALELGLLDEEATYFSTVGAESSLTFPPEHLELIRTYFRKMQNLNSYRKYPALVRYPALRPVYPVAKRLWGDPAFESAMTKIGRLVGRMRNAKDGISMAKIRG